MTTEEKNLQLAKMLISKWKHKWNLLKPSAIASMLQIAVYDAIRTKHCLCKTQNRIRYRDLLTNDRMDVEYFGENIVDHYPYILCKYHTVNLVRNWNGSMKDCLPFHSWNIPFHSDIFQIPHRNFRSISFFIPYHALLASGGVIQVLQELELSHK